MNAARIFANNPHANTWKAFKAAHALRGPRHSVITHNNIRKYISKTNGDESWRRPSTTADFFRALNNKKNNNVIQNYFRKAFKVAYTNQAKRILGINK
jgi:hypothetical protein